MKKFLKLSAISLFAFAALVSCGGKQEEAKSTEPVEITFTTYEENLPEFLKTVDITEEYKKEHPNVTVKIEHVANPKEYDNMMQIRNTGKELPDIFVTRVTTIADYKDVLEPLNDLDATKKNLFAKEFEIDGNVYGIPTYGFSEFVYYRKSIFNELGLTIPKTWPEFLDVVKKIKESGKYDALALGLKDSWVDYPFNEFMPFYENDGEDYLNKMANDDAPFTAGKPFYEAYKKINDLYELKAFGKDPLGYGWDQQRANFVSGKAAMFAAGQWYYSDFLQNADDKAKEDLGVFILPTRNNASDEFRYIVSAEVFMSVNKDGKHVAEAKEFVNWFLTSDLYAKFIDFKKTSPIMEGVSPADDMFGKAIKELDNPKPILQKAGGDMYNKIAKEIEFDVKGMGQEMMKGVDFEKYMSDFNNKWKEAKDSL